MSYEEQEIERPKNTLPKIIESGETVYAQVFKLDGNISFTALGPGIYIGDEPGTILSREERTITVPTDVILTKGFFRPSPTADIWIKFSNAAVIEPMLENVRVPTHIPLWRQFLARVRQETGRRFKR